MKEALLLQLVDYEKSTKRRKFVGNIKISFKGSFEILRDLSKMIIYLENNSVVYILPVDDKFIAQIIKRVWEREDEERTNENVSYEIVNISVEKTVFVKKDDFLGVLREIWIYFHFNLNNNFHIFIKKIIYEISLLDVIYDSKNMIYGFVTPAYRYTNQIQFREHFIAQCKELDDRIYTDESIEKIERGRYIEIFNYNLPNSFITLQCGLVYGKNNGFGSYYVTWYREFKETKAQISPFKTESKYNWQNNPRFVNLNEDFNLHSFTSHIVKEGDSILKVCDEIVKNAQNTLIDSSIIMDAFDSILEKIACARASKDRVKQHYKKLYLELDGRINKNSPKESIWAIAQSLCFTGTFEKAIPLSMRDLIIRAGTELLDDGFEKFGNTYTKDGIKLLISTPKD